MKLDTAIIGITVIDTVSNRSTRRPFMRACLILIVPIVFSLAVPASAGWEEGVAAFSKGDYQTAVSEFQEIVEQNPDAAQGHYMLGLSLQKMKRQDEALDHIRKAYDLNPNDLSVKLVLGRAYNAAGRYAETNTLLESVEGSSLPTKEQAAFYRMRGRAKLETGDSPGALSDFEELMSLRPDGPRAQYLYGTAAVLVAGTTRDKTAKLELYQGAAEAATKLVATAPSYDNLMLKISAELGAGLYEDAIETGKACISTESDKWLAHYYLGQAYASAGQYEAAEAPLETARGLAEKPEDLKQIWRQLGFTYEKQKKYGSSIGAYEKAGDAASVARVTESEAIASENSAIEAENERIEEMREEAKKLEEELKALEEGGGGT